MLVEGYGLGILWDLLIDYLILFILYLLYLLYFMFNMLYSLFDEILTM
jgi:hypothetical protein